MAVNSFYEKPAQDEDLAFTAPQLPRQATNCLMRYLTKRADAVEKVCFSD
jgi:hypothetical protein